MSIQYSLVFEEEAARIYAGMGREEYDKLPGTPEWVSEDDMGRLPSKSHVVAFYRLNNLVNAVSNEAAMRKSRRK